MTKYQLDLLNIEFTHPGLMEMLRQGLFSCRRTENQFSRLPIDLTLEQTVNCDASSRQTGFTASTNSYSGRLQWSVTKGTRAALIGVLFDMVGMLRTNDAQAELSASRIRQDNTDLQKLMKSIQTSAYPFKLDTLDLINVSMGKSATSEITESLLNIANEGRKRHISFIQECAEDADRFEKPIKRNQLKTFSNQGAKNPRAQNPIVRQLRCTRDMFGRIAIVASQRKVDLEYLLSHPLTPVPLTMCKTDGTIMHTEKSALFSVLEQKVSQHGSPPALDVHVIDGNYQLRLLPPTYGGLSQSIIHAVVAYPFTRVDIVFDTYEQPWIKDCERERRGAEDVRYTITGPDQIHPKDLNKALKSTSFKSQLPRFLLKDWGDQRHAHALRDKEVYIGVDDVCARFAVEGGQIHKSIVGELCSNHPEGDTRICQHLMHINESRLSDNDNVVIRASDTDILVILLHHVHETTLGVWMEVGTSGRGDRRYVNVSQIAEDVDPCYAPCSLRSIQSRGAITLQPSHERGKSARSLFWRNINGTRKSSQN